jgi:hypothetical protein
MNVGIFELVFGPKDNKEKYLLIHYNCLTLFGKDNKKEMTKRPPDNLFDDIVYSIVGFLFH